MTSAALPAGVQMVPLTVHRDHRGWLSEIYRQDRPTGVMPCQWNATFSEANVLRGVHVHARHKDHLVVAQGRMSVGLYDLRRNSPTYRKSALFELSGRDLTVVTVPVGVMHGYYCHEPTLYVYGVDEYYTPDDELGCHWADATLGIAWPCTAPILSDRDRNAGTLAQTEIRLRALRPEL